MRLMDWIRRAAGALLLLLPLLLAASAHAEDEGDEVAARTYAREQLIRNAKLSVDPTNPEAGGLGDLKAVLAKKRDLYQRLAEEELQRADLLLGEAGADGLIREAARRYRWLAGTPVEQDAGKRYPALTVAAERWQALVEKASAAGSDAQSWLHPHVLALIHADELAVEINREWVAARENGVAERVAALQAEQPPRGLVNDRTVEEKALRAKALRKTADEHAASLNRVTAALDRMARAERILKEDSGRLGFLIDEARREEAAKKKAEADAKQAEAPKKADPAPAPKEDEPAEAPISEKLARLQLEEIVDEQQLRLLYIAARRADLLQALYGEAIRQAKEEALAAEEVHKLFEAELSRMRRERQLERLAWQAADLKRERKGASETAETVEEPGRRIWAAYTAALENLIDLNEVTREAVALRRALEARAKPECAPGDSARGGGADEEGCLPPEEPPLADAPDAPAPADIKDPLRRFREPRRDTIDATYVRDAKAMLDHEDWSADLAAKHFVAVDDRIQGLETALTLVKDTRALHNRFEVATKAADGELTKVYQRADEQRVLWRWYSRVGDRRENLEADRAAFEQTLRGIEDERKTIRDDLVVFRDYRRALLGLGTRSFQIRVQRTLDPDRLEAAYDDVDATVDRAGRWLTFRGEEHAGTFIQRNWLMLLACLGVLIASLLFVRHGRHVLDRVLRNMASRVPALRSEPVTVRAEEAQAKRERAEQEAAAKAAEEAALREVSKEEADRQQRMGEGGYAGGDA